MKLVKKTFKRSEIDGGTEEEHYELTTTSWVLIFVYTGCELLAEIIKYI